MAMRTRGKLRAFGWLVVAAIALVVALPGVSQAAYPGGNGDLVFHVQKRLAPGCHGECEDASWQGPKLFRMRSDGTRLRRIFKRVVMHNGRPVDFDGAGPVASPDGSRLAFLRAGELVVGDLGSGGLRTVVSGGDPRLPDSEAPGGQAVSWSPDGRRLLFEVFAASGAGAQYLFSVRDDGSDLRQIVRLPWPRGGATSLEPAWSTRNWISFTRQTNRRPSGRARDWNLWLVRPDGSGLHAVTRAGGRSAAWSPSGRTLAYVCGDWLCSLKPGGQRRLLVRHGREPAWSPDGRRLALVGRDGVYIGRPDGSALRRVTRMRPLSLDWQPLPQR
jgi:Tol biopolymer transport system component